MTYATTRERPGPAARAAALCAAILCLPSLAAAAFQDTSPQLAAALDAVREEHLMGDLYFLASDELGGRDTPSAGLRIAALYLTTRLARLGLQPGAEGGWLHEYPLTNRRIDRERSGIALTSAGGRAELAFGEDYFLERGSHLAELSAAGAVVSVGPGSSDDFEAAELEGRWAILYTRGRSVRKAAERAREAGAVGLIVTPDADSTKQPFPEKFARTTKYLTKGVIVNPAGRGTVRATDYPVVMLARAGAAKLHALATAPWDGLQPPTGHALGVNAVETRAVAPPEIRVANVCAFWPGSDPERADEVIVVSAHYDHVGMRGDRIYNGADDNASGTTGLLGVAEALVAYGPLERSVLLLWVSGEEKGLWGSGAWTKDPWLPEGRRPVANINIDMIGRTEPDELYITPSDAHAQFNAIARAAYELSALEGFPTLESQDDFWARSDHANFAQNLAIPVVFLSAGVHPDYHKPTDTADKIDYDKLRRVTRLVVRMLDRLQAADLCAAEPHVTPAAEAGEGSKAPR